MTADTRPLAVFGLDDTLAADLRVRMLVDDDPLVCDAAEAAGFSVVRARWAVSSPELRGAQEKEGRT